MKFNATISADSALDMQQTLDNLAFDLENNSMITRADTLTYARSTEVGAYSLTVGNGVQVAQLPQGDESVPPSSVSDEELHEFAGVLWRKTDREPNKGDVAVVVEDGRNGFPVDHVSYVHYVADDSGRYMIDADGDETWIGRHAIRALEPVRIK